MNAPDTVFMESREIKKCKAIVMFGPPRVHMGERPAVFYQVTIDPSKVSPSGEYIRFGLTENDEIVGWQKISALTVVEILGEFDANGLYPVSDGNPEPLEMMVVKE